MHILTESHVPDEYNNSRIDTYLAKRFDYKSRSAWQKEIINGKIIINGTTITRYNKRIQQGDLVAYDGISFVEPEVDTSYSVLFEDEHIIAINKSGNIPVHPSGIFYRNTLLTHVQNDREIKLFPIHRLDRETSGIILFGKYSGIVAKMQSDFNNIVNKTYLAIVRGHVETDSFSIDTPIGQDLNSIVRKKRAAYAEAKETALTRFKKLFFCNECTLMQVKPYTGRLHQIRVHLEYSGHPIVGDKLYGGEEKLYLEFINHGDMTALTEKLGHKRCALHASCLRFKHPVSGELFTLSAPLPEDLVQLMLKQTADTGSNHDHPLSGWSVLAL